MISAIVTFLFEYFKSGRETESLEASTVFTGCSALGEDRKKRTFFLSLHNCIYAYLRVFNHVC